MTCFVVFLVLLLLCPREMKAEPGYDLNEEVKAVVVDVPGTGNLFLHTDPGEDTSNRSLNYKFEQLMNVCVQEVEMMPTFSWDVVMMVAVVAVSLAEARLLSVTIVKLQLGNGYSAKGIQLTSPSHVKSRITNIINSHHSSSVPGPNEERDLQIRCASC